MKITRMITIAMLSIFVMSGSAFASEGQHQGKVMSDGYKQHYLTMMKERHQMTHDMMAMMKDLAGIIKGLNHKPDADEKNRLGKMMSDLDGMMQAHEDRKNKMKEMHKKKKEMRKERHEKSEGMTDHHSM